MSHRSVSKSADSALKLSEGLGRRALLRIATSGAALASLSACGIFDDDEAKPILPGKRIDILSTGAGLQVAPNQTEPVVLPPVEDVTSWPQQGRISSHLAVNGSWSGTKLLWSRSIGDEVDPFDLLSTVFFFPNDRGYLQSPPVVGDGRIYTVDARGHVRCWTWPKMNLVWHREPAKHTRSPNLGGGIALDGDALYIVDGVSQVMAVDAATGHTKWKVPVSTPGRSAPTVNEGIVVFTTIDDHLYALDAATGQQLWSHPASVVHTQIFGQGAPAFVDGVVVAGFGSGELVAFRARSGEIIWSDSLGGQNGLGARLDFACVRGAPVIVDGTVYAISMSQVMVAIDIRSGRRLWEREVSGQDPLCVCGDWLFVVSLDQQLACVHRLTGQVRWMTQLRRFVHRKRQKGAIFWVGPLLVANKIVCFSSAPEYGMTVVDAQTGKIELEHDIPSSCQVQPIVCDGKVLALGQDGVLRAYG
ncbi:dehydrogenase [Oecophyllibacter saccharovorans]|uniref:Dehydrogenase n=1 Tax=Oecophyllibacter saccharovorans TaxID=2558360 RepID=A0A506URK3_9PROT|nr:PQQ-like beta-propeller repeat protein [Oecophyllibacter saccharovorans]QDH14574.1 dehydrogenase [Oecophyllibacter saccharovorans]TPW35713.1 dehydrogenase [Oecophyllibacter saccharovorans]